MSRQVADTMEFNSARGVVRLVVLGETEKMYFVCSPEEREAARREGRNPGMVGFRKEDVVDGAQR